MVDWVRDGSVYPFMITLVKDGKGVDLVFDGVDPATSLVDGDLNVYSWKPEPVPYGTVTRREVDISLELVKTNVTLAPGEMLWFPQADDTRCNCFTLVIRDASGDQAFDEDRIRGYTHGKFHSTDLDERSRFDGT